MTARLLTMDRVAISDATIGAVALPTLLAISFTLAYLLLGPTESGSNVYVPLADAFLNGRLWIEDRSWLELIPRAEGGAYVPLPPVPAVLLMPIVGVMGSLPLHAELSPNVTNALLGGANVALAWALLSQLTLGPRLLLTVAFASSTHLWIAAQSGGNGMAQLVGVFFTLIALNFAIRGRWPLLAGLALGAAAGSRIPMGLALPVLVYLYRAHSWRGWTLLATGITAIALPIAAYNLARFGAPLDFGYAHIPSGASGLVTDEWWYADGILSASYIPRSLGWALFGGLSFAPPFVQPSWMGLSLLLTAPWIFLALRARGRLAVVIAAGIAFVMLPSLAHGAWGFAQWGYRFILDATPLLLLLVAGVYRSPTGRLLPATVAIGAVVNLAGFWWAAP